MNKAKYEALSDAQKKVIDANSGLALAKIAGAAWDGFEGPARSLAEKAGGKFHTLDGAALEEFKTVGNGFVDEWIEKSGSKGFDGKMLVEKARMLIKKYEQ